MEKKYQLIIIGAGPAGINAGIYAERYGLDFLILGSLPGGAVNEARKVENYLGIKSISGPELTKKFTNHFKTPIQQGQIKKICPKKNNYFQITTNTQTFFGKSLILALGMKAKKINFENSDHFLNQGISYYTPEQLDEFKNKKVAVIGGGDSALDTALKLSTQAQQVYLIHRRNEFRAASSLVKKAEAKTNINFILKAQATKAEGRKKLTALHLDNQEKIKIDQLFIEIGGVPNIQLCEELGVKMEGNFIKTDKNQATNIAGIFAAGDITNNPLKQIITAAAEGAIAAFSAFKYLR